MFKFIFLLFFISNGLYASSLNCSTPKNIPECEKVVFSESKKAYTQFIDNTIFILNKKVSESYIDNFLKIENKWQEVTKEQCNHLREFYQGGSLGRANYISCFDLMYKQRIIVLQGVYDDVIGLR